MASPTRCPRCARENAPGFAFCLDCGQPLGPARPATTEALCASCGAALPPGVRFCGSCGRPTRSAPATPRHAAPAAPPGDGQAVAPPPLPGGHRIRLALIRSDGTPGAVFSLDRGEAICGRTEGEIRLADDPTVSPRHARFTAARGLLRVEDLASVNGTFLRLREARRIEPGDELRIGRQLLRLEPVARAMAGGAGGALAWGTRDHGHRFRLSQLLEGGGVGEIFPLRDGDSALGREAGEVTFPSDRYVSARHARITVAGAEVTVSDAGSSNGTYVKIRGIADLAPGDQLLVGSQLLRVQ